MMLVDKLINKFVITSLCLYFVAIHFNASILFLWLNRHNKNMFLTCSLKMIIRQGRFVEYSVFGKETSVDWTIIFDTKGTR